MKNPLEALGIPRLAGSTIVGYGIVVFAFVAMVMGKITFETAVAALGGAATMIALPQHKATPEDGDKGPLP